MTTKILTFLTLEKYYIVIIVAYKTGSLQTHGKVPKTFSSDDRYLDTQCISVNVFCIVFDIFFYSPASLCTTGLYLASRHCEA